MRDYNTSISGGRCGNNTSVMFQYLLLVCFHCFSCLFIPYLFLFFLHFLYNPTSERKNRISLINLGSRKCYQTRLSNPNSISYLPFQWNHCSDGGAVSPWSLLQQSLSCFLAALFNTTLKSVFSLFYSRHPTMKPEICSLSTLSLS